MIINEGIENSFKQIKLTIGEIEKEALEFRNKPIMAL
jgi:hypothetical protein